jgi:Spy/CpxP family protein refolding chaperone
MYISKKASRQYWQELIVIKTNKLNWSSKMKKIVTAAALISVLTFAGIQSVSAHGGRYFGNNGSGGGYCGNYDEDRQGLTEKDQATLEKFKEDTAGIRKEIVVKRSELNALMRKDNPDETKVAKLTGELYDLETDFDKKAEAAEIDNPLDYEHGPGMMRGYGLNRGGHMMGW